jgi:hypothetical protein
MEIQGLLDLDDDSKMNLRKKNSFNQLRRKIKLESF